jgi:hypothetical protein
MHPPELGRIFDLDEAKNKRSTTSETCNCSDFENLYREGAKYAKEPQRLLATPWRALRLGDEF